MSPLIREAERTLLEPAGLSRQDAERALGRLAGAGADLGELFLQNRVSESWALEDSIVKEGSFSLDRGLGARVLSGEKTGAAYARGHPPRRLGQRCGGGALSYAGGWPAAGQNLVTRQCVARSRPGQSHSNAWRAGQGGAAGASGPSRAPHRQPGSGSQRAPLLELRDPAGDGN